MKGVGAETTDFGPISDFVMLLFNICANDSSFKKSKFYENMLKNNFSMSI